MFKKISRDEFVRLEKINTEKIYRQLDGGINFYGGLQLGKNEDGEPETADGLYEWGRVLAWLVLMCREYGYDKLPVVIEEYFGPAGMEACGLEYDARFQGQVYQLYQHNRTLLTELSQSCNDTEALKAYLLYDYSDGQLDKGKLLRQYLLRLLAPQDGEHFFALAADEYSSYFALRMLTGCRGMVAVLGENYRNASELYPAVSVLEPQDNRLRLEQLRSYLRELRLAESGALLFDKFKKELVGRLGPQEMCFGFNLRRSARFMQARPQNRLGRRDEADGLEYLGQEMELLAAMLAEGGRMVYGLTDEHLQRDKQAAVRVRRRLVEELGLWAVVRLPDRVTRRLEPCDLLLFRKGWRSGEIKMIDARRLTTGDRYNLQPDVAALCRAVETEEEHSVRVSWEELRQKKYNLSPPLYFKAKVKHTLSLGACCDIRRGPVLGKAELAKLCAAEPTRYRYIALKDMQEDGLDDQWLDRLQSLELDGTAGLQGKVRESRIEARDFLLLTKNTPYGLMGVRTYGEEPGGPVFVVSGNTYVLTRREDAPPDALSFVEMYLRTEAGRQLLQDNARGNTLPLQVLKELQIPWPEEEKRRELLQGYLELLRRKASIQSRLRELEGSIRQYGEFINNG